MGRISIILASLGWPIATVGLTVYGMAGSYSTVDSGMKGTGELLMLAGTIAGVVGILGYRASEAKNS
jgi:hypothetical protein